MRSKRGVVLEYELFEKLIEDCKSRKPVLFELGHDKTVSLFDIEKFENMIDIKFSEKYKKLLSVYGGGLLGFANFYSLDEGSDYYLLNHNSVPVGEYLRIADNGCGDYYLLCVEDNKCLDSLFFYDHDSNTVCITEYADILEYLVEIGLGMKI